MRNNNVQAVLRLLILAGGSLSTQKLDTLALFFRDHISDTPLRFAPGRENTVFSPDIVEGMVEVVADGLAIIRNDELHLTAGGINALEKDARPLPEAVELASLSVDELDTRARRLLCHGPVALIL